MSLRLDSSWNKGIVAFLTRFHHLIQDLRELRPPGDNATYNDEWCISNLKTALSTHSAMTSHVQSMASARASLSSMFASMGQSTPALTFTEFFDTLKDHATVLDQTQRATSRRRVNKTNTKNNSGKPSGQSQKSQTKDVTDPAVYLSHDEYKKLTKQQRSKRWERKEAAKASQAKPASVMAKKSQVNPPTAVSVPSASVPDSATVQSALTTSASALDPGHLVRQMMSSATARPNPPSLSDGAETVSINGTTYRRANSTRIYRASRSHTVVPSPSALVDAGANGSVVDASHVRVLSCDLLSTADVVGSTPGTLESLPICQCAAKIETADDGPIIAIFSQAALRNDNGGTILSRMQMECFGIHVDDRSTFLGGTQSVVTTEGYVIPMSVRDGLAYIDLTVPSEQDMDMYPHVFFTSDEPWDPSIHDNEASALPEPDLPEIALQRREARDPRVDDFGDATFHVHSQKLNHHLPDLDCLRPNFGWVPVDRIKATLDKTTQFYRATIHHPFRKHFKSRFPAANVRRLNEWVATDTIICDTPAHDDGIPGHGGCTMLQLFGGVTPHFLAGYPISSQAQIPQTFEDFIRQHGAPVGLVSDNAKAEMSQRIKDLLRMYLVKDRQSEPHYQHQDPIERHIQNVKRISQNIMDRTGCPAKFWLLCFLFVISLLNCLVNKNGEIPKSLVTGEVTDVSPFLTFHFWQEVFFEQPDKTEQLGRWVGVAENVGDTLTYFVLTNDTEKVIARSNVRAAKDPLFPNRLVRPDNSLPDGGEVKSKPVLASANDLLNLDPSAQELPKFSPDELLGLTYLHDVGDGEKMRAKITRKIIDRDAQNHQNIKFLVSVGDEAYEEIMAYNELSDIVARQHEAEANGELDTWTYSEILDHEGPLSPHSPRYKGSSYNVLVQWTDSSTTWEPINIVGKDDPVTLAKYAKEHDLLDTPGWKFLRRIARRAKVLKRMLKQARRNSQRNAIPYKFGIRIPRSTNEAYKLDKENGNTLWADAIELEKQQLMDYSTFIDAGVGKQSLPPGHKLIPCHFVFDAKEDLRRKARFVAGGHLTQPPKDSVYSSVASLRSIRLVAFLAELNGLKLQAADIGNAYLEAKTSEKVAFIAGPEFGPLSGHCLVIHKALYGLRSSGARFHEKFADTLRSMGFTPSFADPDVWWRDAGNVYEYVCCYVDDILCAMKDPDTFMTQLQSAPWNYKLKGVGDPRYHLGADFFRDKDGTLGYGAQTYIKRMLENYRHMFGEDPPKKVRSPLVKGDHPELDQSEPCSPEDITKFQSLIGSLQWTISLCRFDIANAVMTLSRYRAAPLVGHLDRAKRIVAYLKFRPHGTIRFRTGIPNHEAVYGEHPPAYNWMHSIYGNVKEEIPEFLPPPKGKPVRTTTFVDANLMHDFTTGRSATGVLHMLNQTPMDYFSKRQNQVETATYGSEFVAARTAVDQIVDLRFTLRSLGVPLDGPSWMFGDNQSVITNSTIPHSRLSKRWNALSYHRVRESIAAGYVRFHFIDSKQNPADVLTKPMDYTSAWPLLEPLLFWSGDTGSDVSHNQRGVSTGPPD